MAKTKTTTPGLESIDRLEEKIKLLVNTIVRIKGEQTRSAEENGKLKAEIETLKARITTAESAGAEVTTPARGTRPDQEPRHRDAASNSTA